LSSQEDKIAKVGRLFLSTGISAKRCAEKRAHLLVVSDPPHISRLDYCLQPVFKKAGLSYQLIQSTAPTWHADRWWQDKRWLQFCVSEVVKLVYYALAYQN